MAIIQALTITITGSEDGFMYDIYDVPADETYDVDSIDGGCCTSNDVKDALQMATNQARDLIIRRKYKII